MHSLNINYLERLNFSAEQVSVLKKIGEFRGKQELFSRQTPEVLESLQKVAIIESSESSNRLEGVTAPHDRIEALVLESATPKNRSEQEIAGYRDALALIHESARYMDFTVNIILQCHSIAYRYMPDDGGRWKMVDNEIIEKNPGGSIKKIRFRPVSAILTPQAMDTLAKTYKEAINQHHKEPLIVIPLTILDFLCIHPFTDGNGRVARLLTLLLLYHFDYQVGRYISLERIFEESKETYYETLEKSSRGWHQGKHDVFPWMNYFWGVLIRAYREFEERVGTIRTGKGSKTEQIRMAVNRRIGPFAISDIESDCPGISRDMIRIVLRQLRDEKAIILQGKGRGAKWIRKRD
jgi:Fic family protein